MNREKIREFVRDSGLDWHRHWNDDESNQLENFAELIVRECIEQVITGPNGPAHYAVEAALRLKKHFGVEE